jgi:hypothetical protein
MLFAFALLWITLTHFVISPATSSKRISNARFLFLSELASHDAESNFNIFLALMRGFVSEEEEVELLQFLDYGEAGTNPW